jgi:hypothetical protein
MIDLDAIGFDDFPRSEEDIICIQPVRITVRLEEEITIIKKVRIIEEVDASLACPCNTQETPLNGKVDIPDPDNPIYPDPGPGFLPSPKNLCLQQIQVHSRNHCYELDGDLISRMQSGDNTMLLEAGTYVVKITDGEFSYGNNNGQAEPLILIWLHGGRFINKKTGILVGSTWTSLNGYDDVLTIDVEEAAMLTALFFDTNPYDNRGQVTLTVLKDEIHSVLQDADDRYNLSIH